MKSTPLILMMAALTLTGCNQDPSAAESESGTAQEIPMPGYLKGHEEAFQQDPRATNLKWFTAAKYGLFIHYGLYALMENGEWIQLTHQPEPVPVAEYAKLAEKFTAEKFDADFIAKFTKQAGMKYICITSKHHDGYSLWDTDQSDFKTTQSPCGRDLIQELYDACEREGVALFLYYSYAADWKHPYHISREDGWKSARPAYKEAQPEYLYEKPEDFKKYLEFADAQVHELITRFPNIAGIWFDPIMGVYAAAEHYDMESVYQRIRNTSPHMLISFKQGATGTEDYMAPERNANARVGKEFPIAAKVYELNKDKPREICATMLPKSWGYKASEADNYLDVQGVIEQLDAAKEMDANLLLNIGPYPDGSFPQQNVDVLLEVGRMIREGEYKLR